MTAFLALVGSTSSAGRFGTKFTLLTASTVVLFLVNPQSNAALVFTLSIGHASAISVLYNLNERKMAELRGPISDTTSIPLDTHVAHSLARTSVAIPRVSIAQNEIPNRVDLEDTRSTRKYVPPDDMLEP